MKGYENMRVEKDFVLREIAGDYIIIPTGKMTIKFNGLITLNEVGVSIWNMLQEEVSFEQILRGILDEYEVDEATAAEDIREFLERLSDGGILNMEESEAE